MRTSIFAVCLIALAASAPPRLAEAREAGEGGAAQTPRAASAAASTFSVPVAYKKLPNGLRVVVSENHAAPVVVVELMYASGSASSRETAPGFAPVRAPDVSRVEHVGKFEHVRIVNENGGTLNGSTLRSHQLLP